MAWRRPGDKPFIIWTNDGKITDHMRQWGNILCEVLIHRINMLILQNIPISLSVLVKLERYMLVEYILHEMSMDSLNM